MKPTKHAALTELKSFSDNGYVKQVLAEASNPVSLVDAGRASLLDYNVTGNRRSLLMAGSYILGLLMGEPDDKPLKAGRRKKKETPK